jgi:hypothetical protein
LRKRDGIQLAEVPNENERHVLGPVPLAVEGAQRVGVNFARTSRTPIGMRSSRRVSPKIVWSWRTNRR